MDGRLTMFKGKPITYQGEHPGIRGPDGTWTRIWFAQGPPGYNKDTELPIQEYSDAVKMQWAKFAQTGAFTDGLMPELPPPRVCTRWDF
jgi:nucleoporin NUP42